MALIYCSECSKQISDKASNCPNCGNPIITPSVNYPLSQPTSPTNNEENLLHCPKCNSTQLSSNKKGFSGGKALTGAVLTGGIGLLAGTIGSNKIKITCLKCGNIFYPGESPNHKKQKPTTFKTLGLKGILLLILFLIGFFVALCYGGFLAAMAFIIVSIIIFKLIYFIL